MILLVVLVFMYVYVILRWMFEVRLVVNWNFIFWFLILLSVVEKFVLGLVVSMLVFLVLKIVMLLENILVMFFYLVFILKEVVFLGLNVLWLELSLGLGLKFFV